MTLNSEEMTSELAAFAINTRYEDVPDQAMYEAKYLLMDTIGCALAALTTDKGKMTVALSKRYGGPPESSIIGVTGKVSCASAAMANGELIGTVDYDATMAGGHAPPYVLPAPLAMAEVTGASGKELLSAWALGLEISARVASAVQQYHGANLSGSKKDTWSWGTRWGQAYSNFGAAAAAGRLIDLNQTQMENCLGLAGHFCQVLTHERFTMSTHRHMTKYGLPGWQNHGAVSAALLAQMGYLGDTDVFNPDEGFWKFVGYEEWYPEFIMTDLGKNWIFAEVKYKLYPCCGMLHGALDCLYKILEENDLKPEEIENITAYCHPTVAEPCFVNPEIINIPDAQFNPKYVFSVAAHRIKIGVEWQDEHVMRDPKILVFGKKITCLPHPEFGKKTADGRPVFSSKVEVNARGATFVEESTVPRGAAHGTLLTDDELIDKFRHNAQRVLTQDKIEEAVEALTNLEKVDNVNKVMPNISIL
jgi:2-methylcitrate dehydratase PrpD